MNLLSICVSQSLEDMQETKLFGKPAFHMLHTFFIPPQRLVELVASFAVDRAFSLRCVVPRVRHGGLDRFHCGVRSVLPAVERRWRRVVCAGCRGEFSSHHAAHISTCVMQYLRDPSLIFTLLDRLLRLRCVLQRRRGALFVGEHCLQILAKTRRQQPPSDWSTPSQDVLRLLV